MTAFEAANGRIPAGAAVFLRTGWEAYNGIRCATRARLATCASRASDRTRRGSWSMSGRRRPGHRHPGHRPGVRGRLRGPSAGQSPARRVAPGGPPEPGRVAARRRLGLRGRAQPRGWLGQPRARAGARPVGQPRHPALRRAIRSVTGRTRTSTMRWSEPASSTTTSTRSCLVGSMSGATCRCSPNRTGRPRSRPRAGIRSWVSPSAAGAPPSWGSSHTSNQPDTWSGGWPSRTRQRPRACCPPPVSPICCWTPASVRVSCWTSRTWACWPELVRGPSFVWSGSRQASPDLAWTPRVTPEPSGMRCRER